MKYIFIDTNNFLYCSLQTKEKHTPDTLIKLKEILNGNEKVILLLPEVIELEYYKVVEDSFVNNIQNQLGKVKGFINENSDFPEHLVKPVEEKLDRIKQEKRKSKKDAIEVFEKIKGHKNTQSIPFTTETLLKSEKRRIKGKKPSDGSHLSDQDCYVLESLITFFDDNEYKDSKLFICSNDSDFIRESNDELSLYDEIKEDLEIKTQPFKLLHNMLESEFKKEIAQDEKDNINKLSKENEIKENFMDLIKKRNRIAHNISDPFENIGNILGKNVSTLEVYYEKVKPFIEFNSYVKDLRDTLNQIDDLPRSKIRDLVYDLGLNFNKMNLNMNNQDGNEDDKKNENKN